MSFRQADAEALEAGGVLLGRLILDSDDVVVDEVTTPGPYDRRTRTTFHRSRHATQLRVVDAWHASDRTRIYLGDWHSHPEGDPIPSWLDRCDWRRVLRRATYEQGFLFFVIVGRTRVRAWEGTRLTGQLAELEPLPPRP